MGWAVPSWNSGPGPAPCESGGQERGYEDVPSRSFQLPSARVGASRARVSSLPQSWARPAGTTAGDPDPRPIKPMTCSRLQDPPNARNFQTPKPQDLSLQNSRTPRYVRPQTPSSPQTYYPGPRPVCPLPHGPRVWCFLICSFPLILRGLVLDTTSSSQDVGYGRWLSSTCAPGEPLSLLSRKPSVSCVVAS